MTREDVRAYADAGGDQNPLHQDDDVARMVGFPGIIAHGMFTMGHLGACVSTWAGDPANVVRLSAQFRAPVFMGEQIVAGGRVRSLDARDPHRDRRALGDRGTRRDDGARDPQR